MSSTVTKPLFSMTGYGLASSVWPEGEIIAEIKSINGKTLEARLSLPRCFSALELELRRLLREKLSRGSVQLQLSFKAEGGEAFNEERLGTHIAQLKKRCEEFGLKPEGNLDTFLRILQFDAEEQEGDMAFLEKFRPRVLECVSKALESLLAARETEGEKLRNDLLARLISLRLTIVEIEKLVPGVVEDFRARLTKQLKELSAQAGIDFDPVRILTEVGVFSERADVTEELTRLKCHSSLYEETLLTGGVVGRRLDFITQEMFREITTCGNKANSAAISALVVSLKEELEKMREQAQNIE